MNFFKETHRRPQEIRRINAAWACNLRVGGRAQARGAQPILGHAGGRAWPLAAPRNQAKAPGIRGPQRWHNRAWRPAGARQEIRRNPPFSLRPPAPACPRGGQANFTTRWPPGAGASQHRERRNRFAQVRRAGEARFAFAKLDAASPLRRSRRIENRLDTCVPAAKKTLPAADRPPRFGPGSPPAEPDGIAAAGRYNSPHLQSRSMQPVSARRFDRQPNCPRRTAASFARGTAILLTALAVGLPWMAAPGCARPSGRRANDPLPTFRPSRQSTARPTTARPTTCGTSSTCRTPRSATPTPRSARSSAAAGRWSKSTSSTTWKSPASDRPASRSSKAARWKRPRANCSSSRPRFPSALRRP